MIWPGSAACRWATDTLRRPLTWSARSAATRDEYVHDKTTGESQPTGQITATVAVQITVRDFGLLDVVGTHLAGHAALTMHEVSWHADWDNPGWRQVQAAAIAAAIAKGRDYAAALGGQLAAAEHIADPGSSAATGNTGPPPPDRRDPSPAQIPGTPRHSTPCRRN